MKKISPGEFEILFVFAVDRAISRLHFPPSSVLFFLVASSVTIKDPLDIIGIDF